MRTRIKHCRTTFLIITVILLILIRPTKSFSRNYNQTYTVHTKIGNIESSHKMYISVPLSLYNYYQSQNHNTFNIGDFSKFVTPNVFKSIAENIQNVTRNDPYGNEVFANAVLKIVQQIPYNKTSVKFPIETMVDNSGDCDTLSLLAASIMKAGGLDVVLFLYENSPISHMNVGVHLLNDPIYRGLKPFYYEYDDKKYFTAETVGKNWKVGDQPQSYTSTEPKIISLENYEKTSSAQVSSNLDSPLIPSSISLSLIPESLEVKEEGTTITISGSISPKYPKQPVIININHESFPLTLNIFRTVTTDQLGNYSLPWNFNTTGTYTIQTRWNGVQNYAGSDSEKLTIYIGLYQVLNKYEENKTLMVGSEVIQTPRLNSFGNRILNNQPIKKILEKNFTGTNVLLSSEFIILGDGEPTLSEQTITIHSYEYKIFIHNRTITRIIPEKTIIIPSYKQKMVNHLEFTLTQNGEEDYSVSVRLLDNYDISQIIDKADSTFINASSYVRENTWYNIAANIFENQIIIKLFDENNTYITETAPVDYTNSTREFKILIKYEPDSIIVFKNLQAEILDQPTQLVEGNKPPFNYPEFLTSYIPYMQPVEPPAFALPITEITLAAAMVVAVIFGLGAYWALRKRK